MKRNKEIIMNERKYAESCLANKTLGNHPYKALVAIAGYYYADGYDVGVIEDKLLDFVRKHYPDYWNKCAWWDNAISDIAANVKKHPLHEIDEIWVTQSEIDTINNIKGIRLQKLAFTLLCLAKWGNEKNPGKNNNWVNVDFDFIFKLCNDNDIKAKRADKINELVLYRLVNYSYMVSNCAVQVNYIDTKSDNALRITNLNDLGNQWRAYRFCNRERKQDDSTDARLTPSKILKSCVCCGKLYQAFNKSLYCPDCKDSETPNEKTITCKDCGKVFTVGVKNTKTIRCPECQKEENNRIKRILYKNRTSKRQIENLKM